MKTAMTTAIFEIVRNKEINFELIKILSPILSKGQENEKEQIIRLCTEAYETGLGHKEYSAEETYNETFINNQKTK